jgi:DNA-binding CsgD family transcriptional regulator
MSKYTIILLVSSVLWIFLGIRALMYSHKNKLNLLFSLICLSVTIYQILIGICYSLNTNEHLYLLTKLAFLALYLFFPLNTHFYLALSNTRMKAWHLCLNYIPVIIIYIAYLAGLSIFSDFVKYKGEWVGIYKINSWLYINIIYYLLNFLISFLIIFKWGKNTKVKKEKIYAKFILIFFSLLLSSGFILGLILPLLGIYDYFAVTDISFYFYIFGLFYLVSKFRFLAVTPALVAEDILAHISDMVILLDTKLRITMVNNSFKRFFEKNNEQITGVKFSEIIYSHENIDEMFYNFLNEKENSIQTRLFYKKRSERILTDSYISLVKDKFSDIIGILIISRTIQSQNDFQNTYRITGREFEIVNLIVSGYSNKTISRKLNISERTIETHCLHIYNKLKISNKVDLINFAAKFNLLS